MEKRYTPERITELNANEVFVFGSNSRGFHAAGAARIAMEEFGAVWGQGVGLQGQSYAIPTMQGGVRTIQPYVDDFIGFAKAHPELTFYVTRIGCGIAGFRDDEIAPLFADALNMKNVILPQSFAECLENQRPMTRKIGVKRFLEAQNREYVGYKQALDEIKAGQKRGHWIWYVFPQMKGLGFSEMSEFYGISDQGEAEDYLIHPILYDRLYEISRELLQHQDKSAEEIFGSLDAMKVRSCMTLFDSVSPKDVFGEVLDAFFDGKRDERTLKLLEEN